MSDRKQSHRKSPRQVAASVRIKAAINLALAQRGWK